MQTCVVVLTHVINLKSTIPCLVHNLKCLVHKPFTEIVHVALVLNLAYSDMPDELVVVYSSTTVHIKETEETFCIRLRHRDAVVTDCFLKLAHVQVMRVVIVNYLPD